ncbi:putative folylpolyglutamate synthase [Reticulomyxa filosa]|uniref:Putative folylpolyglutamate synthase n=1 Tax=Reticulomyxa filosa TaxID=46433 RepID=X6M9Q3_RETFI|nr:putative folylpolyglutamate synthase [Reticulomyxa filosa]|eukprot:ETO10738.1 putative folylpolyglutamate synthase [Reticulomyxa filosa]
MYVYNSLPDVVAQKCKNFNEYNTEMVKMAKDALSHSRYFEGDTKWFDDSDLLDVKPPFRFEEMNNVVLLQQVRVNVIFDVAHNPDGCTALCNAIHNKYPRQQSNVVVVAAFKKVKDVRGCLDVLMQHCHALHFVQPMGQLDMCSIEYAKGVVAEIKSHPSNIDNDSILRTRVDFSQWTNQHDLIKILSFEAQQLRAIPDKTHVLVICGTFGLMKPLNNDATLITNFYSVLHGPENLIFNVASSYLFKVFKLATFFISFAHLLNTVLMIFHFPAPIQLLLCFSINNPRLFNFKKERI